VNFLTKKLETKNEFPTGLPNKNTKNVATAATLSAATGAELLGLFSGWALY